VLPLIGAMPLGRVEECFDLELRALSLSFREKLRVAVWSESGGYTSPRLMFVSYLVPVGAICWHSMPFDAV
jgi:hypothetical protein